MLFLGLLSPARNETETAPPRAPAGHACQYRRGYARPAPQTNPGTKIQAFVLPRLLGFVSSYGIPGHSAPTGF